MRKLRIGATARVVGLLAIGVVIVITSVHFHSGNVSQADRPVAAATPHTNSLARELLHCQAIGMKAENDAACDAAWAENRRRFLAPLADHPSPLPPSPDARQPR